MCILFFCLFTDQNGNKYLYGAKKSEHMLLAWDMRELMCLGLKYKECVVRFWCVYFRDLSLETE